LRYRVVDIKTLSADVRQWLGDRFARQADWLQTERFPLFPGQVQPRAVEEKFVQEVISSLRADFRLPEDVAAGSQWMYGLGDDGEWTRIADSVAVANGLLHIRTGTLSDLDELTFNLTTARRQLLLPVSDNYFCRRRGSKGVMPTTWHRSVVVVGRLVAGENGSAGAPIGAEAPPAIPGMRTCEVHDRSAGARLMVSGVRRPSWPCRGGSPAQF
jgi:hypothetical protein